MKKLIVFWMLIAALAACDHPAASNAAETEEAATSPTAACDVLYAAFRRPAARLPDRTAFVAECERLPAAAVACLSNGYAMSHEVDCANAKATMDPTVLARMFTVP